ncbi:sensor histidine kinase [Geothrix sp. PMB-07]|uniref:sensor histidine kinase n=1 Tax=Geothrix sp. PMB-07 TaxID=3068640 RepID=UPI0027409D6D|nr:ATP-binding protein [Geothrix sp. PMB-07]WLT30310.1 ATP-binding protein [Geothrix sp. PMB-07]
MPAASSRFSRRLFLDVALPSLAGLGLLLVLGWVGAAFLRRSQLENLAADRVSALQKNLATQGENLDSLGQMLAQSWVAQGGHPTEPVAAIQTALPLLRHLDLVSNLILCSPDGDFVTLVRTARGWDLVEGGRAYPSGEGRLTKQVGTAVSEVQTIRLPPRYPMDRPWFLEGMSLDQARWMKQAYPFVETAQGGLSYLMPVLDPDGRRRGLICIDSTQARLSAILEADLGNPFCRAMITDASQRVAVPARWPLGPESADTFTSPRIEDIPWAQSLLPLRPEGRPAMATVAIGGLDFLTLRSRMDLGPGFQGDLWVAFPITHPPTPLRGWGLVGTLILSLLMLAWLIYLRWMSHRYDLPLQGLLHSAEAARTGAVVPDLDSNIWELRQMGHSLKLAGEAVRERQDLEDQLIRSQRFEIMSALSAGVIHDANNVLSIVMLRIERVLTRGWQTKSVEDLQESMAAARQCATMNRQLLSLGRTEEDAVQVIDLNTCVTDTSHLIRPAIGQTVSLELDLADVALPIAIRHIELTQAILNLALNARDAMPEGGLLQIRTFHDSGEVCLEIEDSGDGIPAAIQDRIFEPYFTTKSKEKGTGLGLAVVKRVVERHQGRIELFRRPERGQGFRMVFPWAPGGETS